MAIKKNKRNIRTRCCAHIQYQNISVLIDTSPDIKEQIKKNNQLVHLALVKQSRLSVMPIDKKSWFIICKLGGL